MRRAAGYDPALDLVAVADGDRLAAFCLSRVDEAGEGSIDTIGTRPEFRRRGLAHSLLLHSLSLLGSRGLKRVRLSTTSQNDAMLRLADALGFVRDAAMDWFARSLPAAR
jgi:ribosomal protein S18 acetylase RimI-like enzyme